MKKIYTQLIFGNKRASYTNVFFCSLHTHVEMISAVSTQTRRNYDKRGFLVFPDVSSRQISARVKDII